MGNDDISKKDTGRRVEQEVVRAFPGEGVSGFGGGQGQAPRGGDSELERSESKGGQGSGAGGTV